MRTAAIHAILVFDYRPTAMHAAFVFDHHATAMHVEIQCTQVEQNESKGCCVCLAFCKQSVSSPLTLIGKDRVYGIIRLELTTWVQPAAAQPKTPAGDTFLCLNQNSFLEGSHKELLQ